MERDDVYPRNPTSLLVLLQGRSQEFAKGGQKRGLGMEVPQRGPGAEPRWRSEGEAPEARDTC